MTDLPDAPKPASFRAIIELWGTSDGSRIAMASDLPGTTSTQVSKWWQRDNIPAEYWAGVLATERARSAGVTADLMAGLAAREVEEARA